jgi:hypothetical protein
MATHLDAVDTRATSYEPEICPNCEADLSGEYCNNCGQKKIHRQDFAVKNFTRQALNEITDLESNKIFKTLVALLFRPGVLAAEYLAGRKGKYLGPIRLYLTFSAIYFLFAWGALSDIRGGGSARAARSPAIVAMARTRGLEPQVLADRVYEKAEKYAGTIRFMSVLVSGLFLSLLYYSTKRFYVEHLIFSLYYYSFDFFMKSFFALLFLISAALGAKLPNSVLNLFYPVALIYLAFALHVVYRQTWPRTALKAVVLFLCESLLFIGVNIAGFIIAFALA